MKIGTKMGNEGLRQKKTYITSQQTNGFAIDGQIGNKKIERQKDRKKKRWKNANGKKMKNKDIKRNCGRYKIEIKTKKMKWT